jgi:hypothetical protein
MFRLSQLAPIFVLGFFYVNVVRAYFYDSIYIVIFITVMLWAGCLIKCFRLNSIPVSIGSLISYFTLIIIMIGFIVNFNGEELYKQLFIYHITLLSFLPCFILMLGVDVRSTVLLLFKVIFWTDALLMSIEVIDVYLGFDIHQARLFSWYIDIKDPGRFFEFKNQSANYFELLPEIIGLRGYPNYSAPLFTASFVVLLAVKFSEKNIATKAQVARFTFFLFGSALIVFIGVKTHIVTLVLSCLFISIYQNRTMLLYLACGLLIALMLALFTKFGANELQLTIEQLFVGGFQPVSEGGSSGGKEAGRLEVIFNLKPFLAILDLQFHELIFGASRFSILNEYDYIFEVKMLILALVLGLPYTILIIILSFTTIRRLFVCFKVIPSARDSGLCFGLMLAMIVFFLDLGHSGYTVNYPNYQVFVLIISLSMIFRLRTPDNCTKKISSI